MHDVPLFAPLRKRGPVATVLTTEGPAWSAPEQPPPIPILDRSPIVDDALNAILDEPLHTGETVAAGFARKERELGAALAGLTIVAAHALHKRLSNPRQGDVLAEKFSRMTVERRNRLLTFLADARRRAALAGAK